MHEWTLARLSRKPDMHTKAQHACLCIVVALLQLSQAAWVPHSTLPSTRHLSHQRGLQQVQDCISPVWQCSMSAGQQMQLSDATHATVLDGNCTALSTSLGLWQCGSNLVQGDVITAVQQGKCSASCIDSQQQLCTQPPAPAPAPGDFYCACLGLNMCTLSRLTQRLSTLMSTAPSTYTIS